MSFDSPLFIFFFSAVLVLYFLVSSTAARRVLLLFSGIFFLSMAGPGALLVFSVFVAVTFAGALLISRFPGRKAVWLGFSIAAIFLSLLALRLHQQSSPDAFFPFGFSFYSFVAVTYLVDVYGEGERPNLFNYGSSLLFFPVIAAGPIVRSTNLIQQQKQPSPLEWPAARRSATRIAAGFFKKSVSELITVTAMVYLSQAEAMAGRFTWLYVLAFVAKYYADFSGYSDIAIGAAGLLGIRIPNNFNLPFLADSISDFWRRWHMTLNWWTNQYVFRPLVYSDSLSALRRIPRIGERIFQRRDYAAILIAMVVIGLWHGINMNYLVWGLYMGALICLEVGWRPAWKLRIPKAIRIIFTFFLVLNGFVIFMTARLSDAVAMWARMYDARGVILSPAGASYLVFCGLALAIPHLLDFVLIKADHLAKSPWLAFTVCVILFSLHFFMDGFYGAAFEYSKF